MKQADDNKTIDLLTEAKQGRGRPRKPDALTGAERAKRFRDAHRWDVAVTEIVTNNELTELRRAEHSRTLALASAHAEIRILTAKLAEQEAEIAALKSRHRTK